MKNLISPLEPFFCEWQGEVIKLRVKDLKMEVSADCLPEFTLVCWQVPIDKDEINQYNKMKEEEMDFGYNFPQKNSFSREELERYGGCPVYKLTNTNHFEEDKMNLSKAYKFNDKCDEDRRAIDMGALTEDGLLTCEGKDLLLNILLSDPKIREQFDKVLKDLDADEED